MNKYNEYSGKFHDKFMSLKIPTVENCCCRIDLRTAGLILGGLTLITNIILIISGVHITWSVISLIVSGCWIGGILKDKPSFMFGYLLSGFLGLIVVLIIPFIYQLITNSDDPDTETPGVEPQTRLEKNIISTLVFIIAGIPSVYFWIVNYSLYKSILERHNESIGSVEAPAPSEVNAS